MRRSHNKTVATLLLVTGSLIPLSASAEFVALTRAAEANQVRILFTNGLEQGLANVQGCDTCPLTLNIAGQTRFFLNGKEINRNRVESLSGKPGTVIYTLDGKQALRILW